MSQGDSQSYVPQFCLRLASRELERRVNAHDPLACENVLQLYPQLRCDEESMLELIYLELVLRQEHGDGKAMDSLITRFPSMQAEIIKLVQVDQAMVGTQPTHEAITNRPPVTGRHSRGPQDQLAEQLGDYQLLEVIGCGGMGIVYKALQLNLRRLVALKTIDTLASFSPNVIARFKSEAELAARLQHPNIVQIFEIDSVSGIPFFSMELVSGGNLAEAIRYAPLRPQVAAQLCQTLARAVGYAHTQGVVHRDLKPANILLAPSTRQSALDLQLENLASFPKSHLATNTFEPKIADFGLAKRLEADAQFTLSTRTGTMLGTPSYMAPEQVDSSMGESDPKTDVYALGAVLYHSLVGRPPFQAASAAETMHQVRYQEPVALRRIQPKIPLDLETICLTCLNKNPSARYQSADALADDLGRFLKGEAIVARAAGTIEKSVKWAYRHPSLAMFIASVAIASLVTTWLWRSAEISRLAERTQRTRAESLVYARDISLAHLEFRSNHVDRCEQILQNCDPIQRNWEWNYLKNQCQEHVWETPRFNYPILSTALSCDGSWLACSYGNWGRDRPEPIRVWNLRTGALAYEIQVPPCNIHCVQFSPDGRRLLSSGVTYSFSKNTERVGIGVWNLEDGTQGLRFDSNGGVVARFLPDGNSFLVGTSSGVIQQYSMITGQRMREFVGHTAFVLDIAVDQNGKEFYSSAKDRTIRRWDLEAGISKGEITKLVNDDPQELELSPNGRRLLVAGWAGSLNTYDRTDSGFRIVNSQQFAGLPHNRYSPDGLYLQTASFGEGAQLRDAHSGVVTYQVHARAGNVKAMGFDRTGRLFVTGNSDGSARVFDLAAINRSLAKASTAGPKIAAIACNPLRPEIALVTELNHLRSKATNMSIELRNLDNLRKVRYLSGHEGWPTCASYSPDGSLLVSGSDDTTVRVWDVETAKSLTILRGHRERIVGVSFLNRQDQLVSVDEHGKIIIWAKASQAQRNPNATADLQYVAIREWNTNQNLTSIALPSNGRYLALAVDSGAIEVWDTAKGKAIAKLSGDQSIRRILFSPDGESLAIVRAGSRSIEIKRIHSLLHNLPGTSILLEGHTDQVNSVSFSKDGRRLVSSSRDESVRMFDVGSGHELLNFHIARGIENLVELSGHGVLIFAEENRIYGLHSNSGDGSIPKRRLETLFDQASSIAWHEQQLSTAKTKGDSWANVFHRRALAELRPPTASELSSRAIHRAYMGDFQGACRDVQEAIEIEDKRSYHEALAVYKLNLHRLEEYQQECKRMIDRTPKSGDTVEINASVWTSALSDHSSIDLHDWIENLEAAYAMAKVHGPPLKKPELAAIENTLGLAAYRCEDYEKAVAHIHASLKFGSIIPAVDHTILAMAYFRLDQSIQAQESLAQARVHEAAMQQAEDSGLVLPSAQRKSKYLELQLLLGEAESLSEKSK